MYRYTCSVYLISKLIPDQYASEFFTACHEYLNNGVAASDWLKTKLVTLK